MFKGLKAVYSFTLMRNISEKMYKILTIVVAIILFVGITGVLVYLGSTSDDEKDSTGKYNVYINNSTDLKIDFSSITKEKTFSKSKVIMENKKKPGKKDIAIVLNVKDYKYNIYINALSNGNIDKSVVNELEDILVDIVGKARYDKAGIDKEISTVMLNEPEVNMSSLEDMDKSLGEIIGKMIFPMIFTIIMFIMIIFYGNSISRMMIAEKDSKLMETLLVYADAKIIALGKILAMYTMAVIQFGIWIISIVGGYFMGEFINSHINKGYKSSIGEILKLLSEHSDAFGISNVVIAIVSMLIGFMLYCFWAGLIASFAKKIEDLSMLMIFYQLPVIAGYVAGLVGPLYLSRNIMNILRYIPFTSVFFVPADVLIGNITYVEAGISVAITIVSAGLIVYITGKMFKKNVFR